MKKEDSIFLTYKKQIQEAIEDLKTNGRRHRQIPNILTLMRLTAPCFIIPVSIMGSVPLILGLTAFFSLTDLADGFIARKWHLTSELGQNLDAVTDKVFASTLLLVASFSSPILLCNLALEGIIAAINTYKKLNKQPTESSIVGKLKTWFLFSLVGAGIASPYFDINSILNTLILSTTVMQGLTIASYLSSNSVKKELETQVEHEDVSLMIPNTNDIEQREFLKEKVLEDDTANSIIQKEESEYLRQLKAMRESLLSEQIITESTENIKDSNGYQKSKKDDFKGN